MTVYARWQRTIVDDAGNIRAGAAVEVRLELDDGLATIYSDRSGTATLSNPFNADSEGFAAFHAAGGAYKITASFGNTQRIWRYVPIGLGGESDLTVLRPAGEWSGFESPSVIYAQGDLVTHREAGSPQADVLLFVSLIDNNENNEPDIQTPGDTAAWMFLGVAVGVVGEQGVPGATGATGDAGTAGAAGIDGLDPGTRWLFDSATSMANPGTGDLRLDNAVLASVTNLAVSALSSVTGNPDVSDFVVTFDDSTTVAARGNLLIKKTSAPQNFAIYRVNGAIVDNGTWLQIPVTHVASSGSLSNADQLSVEFERTGDAGTSVAGVRWNFDSSIVMADPGSGDIRFNNATLSSVTAASISDLCAETGSPDVSTFVLAWDDSTNTTHRGTLIIRKFLAPENFVIFSITDASTDNVGWTELALTYVTHNGSFSNADALVMSFARTGNVGAAGAGTGDVVGPAASVAGEIALFDLTTGKLIKRATTTGLLKATSGVLAAAVAGTDYYNPGGTDVAVADGGSGSSTPIGAFDAFSTHGADVASATTTNLGAATGDLVDVTGTTTITGITLADGKARWVRFTGILTLTHGASLVLPGAANITTAAGDAAYFRGYAAGVVRCLAYVKANGGAVVGSSTVGTQATWIPAAAFVPEATNGPSRGITSLATSLQQTDTLDFDTTTQEFAVVFWKPPKRWNLGTLTFAPHWTAASGSGTVEFAVQGVAVSNDDPLNATHGTEQVSNDTLTAALDLHIGATSSAITLAGTPTAGDGIWLRVKRNVANDTLAVDAKLLGIEVFWTSNAATDA